MQKKQIKIDNEVIPYKIIGSGEPIVLVHGLSASSKWWSRNIQFLAKSYTVYLVDLPGFGDMHHKIGNFTLKTAEHWLITWMNALGIKQSYLIGNSMGGYICLQIAAHYPERVKKLILVSPVGIQTGRTIKTSLIPLLLAIRYMSPAFLPILFSDALRAGLYTVFKVAQDVLVQDASKILPFIKLPTLIMWGKNDMLIPSSYAKKFHEEIRNSELVILKGAGHVLMFDRPNEFNNAVLRFLKKP